MRQCVEIPEKARGAPTNYKSTTGVATATATITTYGAGAAYSVTSYPASPPRPSREPSREWRTPPQQQQLAATQAAAAAAIEPPSRHLAPPPPPSASKSFGQTGPSSSPSVKQQQQIQQRQLAIDDQTDKDKQQRNDHQSPAQFSLGMNKASKQRMRFRRGMDGPGGIRLMPLPHQIEENFPVDDFETLVGASLLHQRRKKRSINGGGDDNHHHHHHDHDEPVDRGCTILGVYYELGQVVGNNSSFLLVKFISKTNSIDCNIGFIC